MMNKITMYSLMIYFLGTLLAALLGFSYLKILPYDPVYILTTTLVLCLSSIAINSVVAKIMGAYTNVESAVITGQILSLILGPLDPRGNILYLVSVSAMAIFSKYILTINKRHVFNPAAAGVVLSALLLGRGASWWVGSAEIFGLVVAGSIMILFKLKRFTLAWVFLASYFLPAMILGIDPLMIILYTPMLFFTSVMLIEPLTSPSAKNHQILYAAFAGGLLLTLQMNLKITYTLELGLVIANIFSYLMSRPIRVEMKLTRKIKIAQNTYSFHFDPAKRFNFDPGQYMSWTLPHKGADRRGVRRFFTISSSPNEGEVVFSIKVPPSAPSSFKKTLMEMKSGEKIVANDPAGDFVLPRDRTLPLAFVAGGIGITPFISMATWLIERQEKRDIVLLYINSTESEISNREILDKAKKYGLRTIFVVTERDGHMNIEMIKSKIPDFEKRMFYISGPQIMVSEIRKTLKRLGNKKIMTDYFPGYDKND